MGFEIAALEKRVLRDHLQHLVRFLNVNDAYWHFRITFLLLNVYLELLILLIVYQLAV
jgi:hypothetical protein